MRTVDSMFWPAYGSQSTSLDLTRLVMLVYALLASQNMADDPVGTPGGKRKVCCGLCKGSRRRSVARTDLRALLAKRCAGSKWYIHNTSTEYEHSVQ